VGLELSRLAETVERVLRGVEVPGFDIDVVSSGVVRSFRLSRDGRRVAVFVDFLGSDPGCGFCRFVNHTLWSTIARRIREALRASGFDEVSVVDVRSGAEL
jgi:metal-sulfur cluster biosynthetic enzyme